MDSTTSQIILAIVGLVSTLSTGLFGYLKYRDDIRIKVIQQQLGEAKSEVADLKKKLDETEDYARQMHTDKDGLQARLDVLEEEKERMLKKIARLEDHEVTCNRELNRLKVLLEARK